MDINQKNLEEPRVAVCSTRVAILASAVLVLAGCAASGIPMPAPADLGSEIAVATPPSDGPVKLFGGAIWRPDAIGFGGSETAPRLEGTLVLTEKSLLWQGWDRRSGRLKIQKRILLSDIRVVSLAESGSQRLIVVQGKDFSYDSFGLTGPGSLQPDSDRTLDGYETLLTLLALK